MESTIIKREENVKSKGVPRDVYVTELTLFEKERYTNTNMNVIITPVKLTRKDK